MSRYCSTGGGWGCQGEPECLIVCSCVAPSATATHQESASTKKAILHRTAFTPGLFSLPVKGASDGSNRLPSGHRGIPSSVGRPRTTAEPFLMPREPYAHPAGLTSGKKGVVCHTISERQHNSRVVTLASLICPILLSHQNLLNNFPHVQFHMAHCHMIFFHMVFPV